MMMMTTMMTMISMTMMMTMTLMMLTKRTAKWSFIVMKEEGGLIELLVWERCCRMLCQRQRVYHLPGQC
jgi:hypothetical protein